MSAPNISLLGAVYPEVSGVTLPKQGGGTASFPWVEGSETKTQNGTYDVTNLAQLIVNVSGGGGSGLVYETGEYKPSSDIAQPTINFSNSHDTPPFFVLIEDATDSAQTTNYSDLSWVYLGWYRFSGYPLNAGGTTNQYARRQGTYRSNSTTVSTTGSNDTSNSTTNVSSSAFKPSNGSNYYWRSGRTYKWIAVWAPTT